MAAVLEKLGCSESLEGLDAADQLNLPRRCIIDMNLSHFLHDDDFITLMILEKKCLKQQHSLCKTNYRFKKLETGVAMFTIFW